MAWPFLPIFLRTQKSSLSSTPLSNCPRLTMEAGISAAKLELLWSEAKLIAPASALNRSTLRRSPTTEFAGGVSSLGLKFVGGS